MLALLEVLFVAGLLLGPLTGYALALRRPSATRAHVVLGAMLGGAAVGALIVLTGLVGFLSRAPESTLAALPVLLPYLGLSALNGAVIGLLGVGARALGAWLRGRV